MPDNNRVLIVGASRSGKLTLVNRLFGSTPEIEPGSSHLGLIHPVKLKTKYYTKELQLWIDEIEEAGLPGYHSWVSQFQEDEFKELRDVVSGLIFCVNLDSETLASEKDVDLLTSYVTGLLEALHREQSQDEESYMWSGFCMVVGITRGNPTLDPKIIQEIFWDRTLEFTFYKDSDSFDQESRDIYGEKIGLAKVLDTLECHEWSEIQLKTDPEQEAKEKTKRLKEMNVPLLSEQDPEDPTVELEDLMKKINLAKAKAQAILDKSERQQFAQQFVQDIIDYI